MHSSDPTTRGWAAQPPPGLGFPNHHPHRQGNGGRCQSVILIRVSRGSVILNTVHLTEQATRGVSKGLSRMGSLRRGDTLSHWLSSHSKCERRYSKGLNSNKMRGNPADPQHRSPSQLPDCRCHVTSHPKLLSPPSLPLHDRMYPKTMTQNTLSLKLLFIRHFQYSNQTVNTGAEKTVHFI